MGPDFGPFAQSQNRPKHGPERPARGPQTLLSNLSIDRMPSENKSQTEIDYTQELRDPAGQLRPGTGATERGMRRAHNGRVPQRQAAR